MRTTTASWTVTPLARTAAQLLAAITLAGLIIRVILATEQFGSFFSGVSHLFQFFTIATNTLVLWVMGSMSLNRPVHRILQHATVVSIVGVGIIFHALLSHAGAQHGLDGLANLITHTLVPSLTLFWWLVFADLRSTRWRDSLFSLIWPSAYCVYALVRAEYSNFYPYPFINLETLGWIGLLKSVGNLSLAFLVLALLTIAYARTYAKLILK